MEFLLWKEDYKNFCVQQILKGVRCYIIQWSSRENVLGPRLESPLGIILMRNEMQGKIIVYYISGTLSIYVNKQCSSLLDLFLHRLISRCFLWVPNPFNQYVISFM